MIPAKIRKYLAEDPFMKTCIHSYLDGGSVECSGRVEWEHAWVFAGKQIQEAWSIVPCCYHHHRGMGLEKNFNRYIALVRAYKVMPKVMAKYPKKNWAQELKYLEQVYGKRTKKEQIPEVPEV